MNLLYRRSSPKIGRAPHSSYVFRACVGAAMLGALFFCVQGGDAAKREKKRKTPSQIAPRPAVGPIVGMAGPEMDNMVEMTQPMPYPPPPLKRRLLGKLKTTLQLKPQVWQEVVPFLGDALDLQFRLNYLRSEPPGSPVKKTRLAMWRAVRGKQCDEAAVRDLMAKWKKAKAQDAEKIAKTEKEFASVQKEILKRVKEPRARLVLFLFDLLPEDQVLATKK